MQRGFAEPNIIIYAEFVKTAFDCREFFFQCSGNHFLLTFFFRQLQIAVAYFCDNALGGIDDILAVITFFRERIIYIAQFLTITGFQRESQIDNLIAGIVNVIFLGDIVSSHFEQIGQGVAQCTAARVPHVQQAGRVGTDKLDLYFFSVSQIHGTVSSILRFHNWQNVIHPIRGQVKIDKTGTGNFYFFNQFTLFGQTVYNGLGDISRFHFCLFCEQHGGIGGKVSMRFIFRYFYNKCRHVHIFKTACGFRLCNAFFNFIPQLCGNLFY